MYVMDIVMDFFKRKTIFIALLVVTYINMFKFKYVKGNIYCSVIETVVIIKRITISISWLIINTLKFDGYFMLMYTAQGIIKRAAIGWDVKRSYEVSGIQT